MMSDILLDRTYRRGDRDYEVRLIQEWLCLHDILTAVDGDFGPATERAVRIFQRAQELEITGTVEDKTYSRLILPMLAAQAPIPVIPGVTTLGSLIVNCAMQHLGQHPREVGGQNRGPWVRLYMDEDLDPNTTGRDGKPWKWCAGYAMYIVRQACEMFGVPNQITGSFDCDILAIQAKKAGIFVTGEASGKVPAGSLFLVRGKRPGDWVHTGIVTHATDETLDTNEGNTNEDGSSEGSRVCDRVRSRAGKDFIIWRQA